MTCSHWRSPPAPSRPARPPVRDAADAAPPRTNRARCLPRLWGGGTERGTCHLGAYETLYRMQARSRGAPVVLAVPREPLAKRFGDAPPVRVTEPGQHGPR